MLLSSFTQEHCYGSSTGTHSPAGAEAPRYTAREYNQIMKDKTDVDLRVAFCFPDLYEIGMCNIGMRILYSTMNRLDGVWVERVFAPWGDMEDEMRAAGIPLWALESGDPVSEFDVVAFSVGYEMAYTAVLDMLDLSGIPLRSADRPDLVPLVIAGGTSCMNPEPMAPFVDLMIIGEGEEVNNEVLLLFREAAGRGVDEGAFPAPRPRDHTGRLCPFALYARVHSRRYPEDHPPAGGPAAGEKAHYSGC